MCSRSLALWISFFWVLPFVVADTPTKNAEVQDLLEKAEQALDNGEIELSDSLATRGLSLLESPDIESHLAAAVHLLAGRIARQTGEWDQALASLSQAMELADPADENSQATRGSVFHEMGVCWARRANWEEAAKWIGQALDVRQRHLGPEHTEVAESLEVLAKIDASQGSTDAAIQSITRAIEIYEKNLGLEHSSVVRARFFLARIYRVSEKFESAERELNQVLDGMNRLLGKEHPDVAEVYRELGSVHLKMGKTDRAVLAFEATSYIEGLQFDKGDPRRVRTLLQLGEALVADDKTMEAEVIFREAKSLAEKKQDGKHPDVAFAWYGLGQVYTLWRNDQEAASAFESALRIFERHPHQMGDMIRNSLIEWYRSLVRLDRRDQLNSIKQKLMLYGVTDEELEEPEIRKRLNLKLGQGF